MLLKFPILYIICNQTLTSFMNAQNMFFFLICVPLATLKKIFVLLISNLFQVIRHTYTYQMSNSAFFSRSTEKSTTMTLLCTSSHEDSCGLEENF